LAETEEDYDFILLDCPPNKLYVAQCDFFVAVRSMTTSIPGKYSAKEWGTSIAAFNSLLNDTLIAGLEQNVGVFWPLKGSDETPVKYNEFQSEAHHFVPGLIC
jgi:hypothetical protein